MAGPLVDGRRERVSGICGPGDGVSGVRPGRGWPRASNKTLTVNALAKKIDLLAGACSCTVKDQNPGVDLLFTCDWEATADKLSAKDTPLERDVPRQPLGRMRTAGLRRRRRQVRPAVLLSLRQPARQSLRQRAPPVPRQRARPAVLLRTPRAVRPDRGSRRREPRGGCGEHESCGHIVGNGIPERGDIRRGDAGRRRAARREQRVGRLGHRAGWESAPYWDRALHDAKARRMIVLEHVSKSYEVAGSEVRALDDVQWEVPAGRFVVVRGRAGRASQPCWRWWAD